VPIDYSKYPPSWKIEIRPRILKRANMTCEVEDCEFRHLEQVLSVKINGKTKWIKATEENDTKHPNNKLVRVVLTIAHLDHDEDNHNVKDDRLSAMCQIHHLRYDAEEKKRRRKLKS
jgi:hypothetical protein